MALQITTHLNIDFYDDRYILIKAKQNDDESRWLTVACYNQGNTFQLNERQHSVYVKYRKPNGYGDINSCRINYRGEALVELTKDMLSYAGICNVELIIANKGSAKIDVNTGKILYIDNASILSTMKFQIDVSETTIDNSIIEDSENYDGLIEIIKKTEADFEEVVLTAKSYAVGKTGIRENENEDNAKHYSELSKSYAVGDAGSKRVNENTDNAKYYSEQAKVSADSADESEANALEYMNNANTYMNSANEYMTATKTYMDNAKTSETNAKTSETNAKNSEINAGKSEANALASEQKAKTSEDNAASSESNAATSESNAQTYMNNAKASETSAKTSETNAASSASAASLSEINAKISETNSANSASVALTSANNASASEINAASSAASASASEQNAATSETNAGNYYTWTDQAVKSVGGVFYPMGTITYSELADIKNSDTLREGHLYNISDSFTSDETFKDGAGIEYVAGTNVYFTSDGYWDTLVGTTMIADVATVDETKDYLGI